MEKVKWSTLKEFQEKYPLFARKANQLCRAKGFPAVKVGGTWAINLDDVDPWLMKNYGSKPVIPPRTE